MSITTNTGTTEDQIKNSEFGPNKHIADYLDYYCSLEAPGYAVLLDGPWGSGKTYFVKEYIKKSSKKFAYVSLFGFNSVSQINEAILKHILGDKIYYTAKYSKKILTGVFKKTIAIDLNNDENSDFDLEGKIEFFSSMSKAIQDIKIKRILILDDLERCNIEEQNLFGYINNLVEHQGYLVVLISYQNKLKQINTESQLKNNYSSIKDKLVGRELTLVARPDKIFLTAQNKRELINFYEEEELLTFLDIFHASTSSNLRHLKLATNDTTFMLKNLPIDSSKSNTKNIEIIKNLIYTYFIISLELQLSEYSEIPDTLRVKFDDLSEDSFFSFGAESALKTKHGAFFNSNKFDIKTIIEFIKYRNKENFESYINQVQNEGNKIHSTQEVKSIPTEPIPNHKLSVIDIENLIANYFGAEPNEKEAILEKALDWLRNNDTRIEDAIAFDCIIAHFFISNWINEKYSYEDYLFKTNAFLAGKKFTENFINQTDARSISYRIERIARRYEGLYLNGYKKNDVFISYVKKLENDLHEHSKALAEKCESNLTSFLELHEPDTTRYKYSNRYPLLLIEPNKMVTTILNSSEKDVIIFSRFLATKYPNAGSYLIDSYEITLYTRLSFAFKRHADTDSITGTYIKYIKSTLKSTESWYDYNKFREEFTNLPVQIEDFKNEALPPPT